MTWDVAVTHWRRDHMIMETNIGISNHWRPTMPDAHYWTGPWFWRSQSKESETQDYDEILYISYIYINMIIIIMSWPFNWPTNFSLHPNGFVWSMYTDEWLWGQGIERTRSPRNWTSTSCDAEFGGGAESSIVCQCREVFSLLRSFKHWPSLCTANIANEHHRTIDDYLRSQVTTLVASKKALQASQL